jgi:hypothetical protein
MLIPALGINTARVPNQDDNPLSCWLLALSILLDFIGIKKLSISRKGIRLNLSVTRTANWYRPWKFQKKKALNPAISLHEVETTI